MKRSISLRMAILGAALVAIVAGVSVWAFGQDSKDVSTGQFSVGGESTSISVEKYNALTGNPDPTWASCSAANLNDGDGAFCALKVTNLKSSSAIRYNFETLTVNDNDGKGLADKLVTRVLLASSPTTCNAGSVLAGPAPLSSKPGFGDSALGQQAGDRTLAIGGSEWICVKLVADFSGGVPYNSTTSANFRIGADDDGLE